MLSWPTGGGHGRSLITLISTASVAKREKDGGKKREQQQKVKEGSNDRSEEKEKRYKKGKLEILQI